MSSTSTLFTLALFLSSVFSHPGHNVAEEAAERAEFMKREPRSVQSCSSHLVRRGHAAATIKRREALANKVRTSPNLINQPLLHRRDFAAYNFSHESTTSSTQLGQDETLLFADNSSCVLQSEVTQGPYYVDGSLIRPNVTESQAGVPLFVDVQIIDTSTCEPLPAIYLDFWHCNATGVYSGVIATGNGNDNDTSNIDATFLRGIQQTDFNGVVQFETIFPGHYTGRATHVHLLAHQSNATTVYTNSTLISGNGTTHASHVGQLFFDQDLISLVETTEPYASNTADTTLNSDDMILSQEANTTDPFVEYVLLGEDISDGILAWISIGIDPTADNEVSAASTLYKEGGVANENAMGGDGGGTGAPGGGEAGGTPPGGGAGGAPSGAMSGMASGMPTGSAPPAAGSSGAA